MQETNFLSIKPGERYNSLMKKELVMYTDGASRGNPGPGGWAAVILIDDKAMEVSGFATKATNNQMELTAVLKVLSDKGALSHKGAVTVYSDSAYVVNGLNSWVYGWVKNNWVTSTKTKVENKEIWSSLLELLKEYGDRLAIKKIAGHSGELYNERCDQLAVAAATGKKVEHFQGDRDAYEVFLKKEVSVTTVPKTKKPKNDAPAFSYVSLVNGKVYVDKTWASCEKRVKGVKGAKFKKVFSKNEETALVQDYTINTLLF